MKRRIYAVRDSRVGTFAPPCLFENDSVAIRAFGDMVKGDKGTLISLHPEDFTLVAIGAFDVENGQIIQSVEDIKVLATASDFVTKEV